MNSDDNILVTGDAYVARYERTFDSLTVHLTLWNEKPQEVRFTEVTRLEDIGTWECDAILFDREFDDGEHRGFAVVDTDGVLTLRVTAGGMETAGEGGTVRLGPYVEHAKPST